MSPGTLGDPTQCGLHTAGWMMLKVGDPHEEILQYMKPPGQISTSLGACLPLSSESSQETALIWDEVGTLQNATQRPLMSFHSIGSCKPMSSVCFLGGILGAQCPMGCGSERVNITGQQTLSFTHLNSKFKIRPAPLPLKSAIHPHLHPLQAQKLSEYPTHPPCHRLLHLPQTYPPTRPRKLPTNGSWAGHNLLATVSQE